MSSPSKIRLLVVDDHFVIRVGLIGSLQGIPDLEVVGEAADGETAIALHATLRPDVTIIDARLPRMSGFDAVATIRMETPDARFVMLSIHDTEEDIHHAYSAGVGAFLHKSVDRSELLDAIRRVSRGECYRGENIASKLKQRATRSELSPRELAVLVSLAEGRSNKEIADHLGISAMTVKIHVSRILEKLKVLDRTQAISAALQRGLIRLP